MIWMILFLSPIASFFLIVWERCVRLLQCNQVSSMFWVVDTRFEVEIK